MLLDLLQNIALLVALAVGLQTLAQWFEDRRVSFRIAAGLLFGLVGMVGMMTPVRFAEGVIYDGRSIVLSLAGLFGGTVPAVVAMLLCGGYRLFIGGVGALVGTLVVVEAGLLGIALRQLRKRNPRWVSPLRLLVFGVLVHAVMLGLQLLLPGGTGWRMLGSIGPVVLVGYPIAFLLVAHVFLGGERRREALRERTRALDELRSRERFLATVLRTTPDGFWVIDAGGRLTEVNDAYCAMSGYRHDTLVGMTIGDLDATESREETAERMRSIIENGSAVFETLHRHRDGHTFPVEVSVTYVEEQGGRFVCFCRDLSARRETEQQLAHSHDLLAYIVDHANGGVAVHDRDMRYIYVSQSYIDMYRLADRELIGKHHYEVFPDLPQKWRDVHQRVLGGEVCSGDRDPFPREDGGLDWTRWQCRPWYEAHGAIGGLIVYTEVITESVVAEQALRASEERFRLLADLAPVGIVISDRDEQVLFVSSRFVELFGYTVEDMPSVQAWWTLAYPDATLRDRARREWSAALAEAQARGEDLPVMEFPVTCKDGRVRQVEIRATSTGELNFVVLLDITRRVKALDALRRNEAFQSTLIACTPFALYSIDGEGRVQFWNESAERLFGWPAAEVLGERLPIVPEDQQEEFAQLRAMVLRGENFVGREVTRLRKDGSTFAGRLSTAAMHDADGQVIGIMGAMEDITENKRLEEQLRQSQKMESVGRLAGGVAHDFNNMLNVILGHAELALDGLPEDAPVREDLREIETAARRSAALTRQLLAFARRQTIEPLTLDLNDTIGSMLNMLRRLIGEDIDLLWRPGTRLDTVLIDPAQVDQLLANLVVNARDAIGPRVGKVTIETSTAVFDQEYANAHAGFLQGRYVMLAVSDDGCGMDAATRAQIFEPFFTTKGVGEGSGLGLATVYGIVKQNNGFINVYSEPGQGTTFRVYLPAQAEAPQTPRPTRSDTTPRGAGETILLVEDETSLLTLTTTMLERLGYRVLPAVSPREALETAREHDGPIQLLLTDVVMPEMNGRDLAEVLRGEYPDIRCLFMSGYTANVIAHQGVLEDGVDFIQKPFAKESLGRRVRQVLDR